MIAGGKPAKHVLVSRNILEVTISKEACPSPGADGMPLLDISVATPNGVSNHLLMKMRPPRPDHKESDKDPSEATEQKPPPKSHVGSAKTRETAHHGGKDQDKAIK